ncbi:hypothetical protein CIP100275_00332 [Corynebacterium diphtheriae]|nr:hypothetical protein CIP100275_00332 [Corynebacterium diphtheriae]
MRIDLTCCGGVRGLLYVGVQCGVDGVGPLGELVGAQAFFAEVFQHVVAEESVVTSSDASIG